MNVAPRRAVRAAMSLAVCMAAGCGSGSEKPSARAPVDASVEGSMLGDEASSGDDSPCLCSEASVPLTCSGATGWGCAVAPGCGAGTSAPTTLTGRVFDPAGVNPLYDVTVFIPEVEADLPFVASGTRSCGTCDAPIGKYVAATTTDATGAFSLTGVPTGTGVPVTVQIGKWRRTIPVDIHDACSANSVPDGTLRLPRSYKEGTLPQMALLTGGGDDLGCFLRRVGVETIDFVAPQGFGSVHVFQGVTASAGVLTDYGPGLSVGIAGDCTGASCPLWSSKSALERYDIVLLSCEGDPYTASKPPAAIQALHDWLAEGGRVLATHSQSTWFEGGPLDFQRVAQWTSFSTSLSSGKYAVSSSFPKGAALESWLATVGLAADAGVPLSGVAYSLGGVNAPTAAWLFDPLSDAGALDASPSSVKYLSFGVPPSATALGPDGDSAIGTAYCGKAAFTDIHAGNVPEGDLPGSCQARALSPEELVLEFLLFDLSGCVTDDLQAPPPPPASQ